MVAIKLASFAIGVAGAILLSGLADYPLGYLLGLIAVTIVVIAHTNP